MRVLVVLIDRFSDLIIILFSSVGTVSSSAVSDFVSKLDINLLINEMVCCDYDYPPIPSDIFSKEVNQNYSIDLLLIS